MKKLIGLILAIAFLACGAVIMQMHDNKTGDNSIMRELNVTKTTLENGMKVLVNVDRSAPVATVNVWVKTGYFNETDEWTGISHLIEHMFFKGTPTRPVGKIQDEVKSVGGYWNAGTIYDHTNYYIVVPSSEVNRALDIEADALINSTFPADELAKEQEVVIQEILRKYDRPGAMVWENMMALLFREHHLGRWRMGTPEQVRSMNRDVLVDYYTNRYRPENIILVVAGDVDAQAVISEARRLFGPLERGELKEFGSPAEPPQGELRYRQETSDITQSYLALGFQAPPALSEDEYAMEVMAQLLGSGKSSRLYRAIKERSGLVNTISAGYYSLPGVGAFYVDAELEAAKMPAVRAEIFKEIERLKNEPPTDFELEKIKTSIEYGFVSSMEEVSGQSNTLAYYESLGGYELAAKYIEGLRAVSPEDVSRVAAKYLSPEKASVSELRPPADADDTTAQQVAEGIGAAIADAAAGEANAPEPPIEISVKDYTGGATAESTAREHVLSNGIKVVTHARPRLPLVSVGVYFPGGVLWDTAGTAGLTRLTLSASLKGTKTRTAEQIQDEIDFLGAGISASSGNDYASFNLSCLSRKLPAAFDIVADVLKNATFPPDEIEKERETQLANIKKMKDNMFGFPMMMARRAAFGGHPYGEPAAGYEDTVGAFTREQIVKRYGELVRADGALVVAVGDFDEKELLAMLEEKLGALPADSNTPDTQSAPEFTTTEEIVQRDKSQTGQAFAFKAVSADSELVPALNVLRNIASGMGGKLYDEVREKNNLAYTVYATLSLNKTGGLIVSYAATSPENEQKARDLMLQEWRKMADGEITQEEFENAVNYTVGIHQIGMQANRDYRAQYARNYFMGRGLDYHEKFPKLIRALTLEDVKNTAAQLVTPDSYSLGILRGKTEN